ncbi:MAG: magnesium/cobalt transporter CorA [Victivallaceae bacterium]|nr:magnesium/cobalt transporter CorA [Victivallaceae bacterium]
MISLAPVKSKYELFGKHPGYLQEHRNDTAIRLEMLSFNTQSIERVKAVSLREALSHRSHDRINWIICHGIPPADELEFAGREFKLDSLILEDIQNCTIIRPGYTAANDYFFAMLNFPFQVGEAEFKMIPLGFVASGNTLVTFQNGDDASLEPLIDRVENRKGRICDKGVDYLAFCHLDLAVDYYFMFINKLSGNLEQIEGRIISFPSPDLLPELQKFKRIAASMRKSVWPLREMIHAIRSNDTWFISGDTEKYYQDLDSHMLLIFDNAESVREMISGLLEIYLSSVSNRMNEIMKVLTLIATIFIPLTFVAGVYGMNFANMPELRWRYGYFLVLTGMGIMAVIMLIFFRRRKWL